MAQLATDLESHADTVEWRNFLAHLRWRQGEHVTLLGPTGCGKTTLARELLPLRRHVVAFGTKPRDDTLEHLINARGYRRIREWPPAPTDERIVLWPRIRHMSDVANQKRIFKDALAMIYEQESWCIFLDEIEYLTGDLRLDGPVRLLWRQGRSISISILGGTQRPTHIPLLAYSQATHLFVWNTNDIRDLKRLMEISGTVNKRALIAQVRGLDRHSVLYVDTRTGYMAVTRVEGVR